VANRRVELPFHGKRDMRLSALRTRSLILDHDQACLLMCILGFTAGLEASRSGPSGSNRAPPGLGRAYARLTPWRSTRAFTAADRQYERLTHTTFRRRSRCIVVPRYRLLSSADADIRPKDGDVKIYRTDDHPIGHTGTAERPRQRPNNRTRTRRSARTSARCRSRRWPSRFGHSVRPRAGRTRIAGYILGLTAASQLSRGSPGGPWIGTGGAASTSSWTRSAGSAPG